jgi:hypothetical protein
MYLDMGILKMMRFLEVFFLGGLAFGNIFLGFYLELEGF